MIVVAGMLYGLIAGMLFRRMTDAERIRSAVNRLLAHIMEFRLFVEEPVLIWRAQWGALKANLALLREIARPTAAMVALFALMWVPMDRYFGHGPLPAGEPAVISARTDQAPVIPGVIVETPGVRVARTGRVSWRIRPLHALNGGIPAGYEVLYPKTDAWLLWFLASSSVGALAAATGIK